MHGRLRLLGVALVACTAGCNIVPLERPVWKPSAPVPPTQEIVVLDPGVDPEGKPTPVPRLTAHGTTEIDIPPAVLVHKFFYSGDRDFQAQFLPGGPSVVVAQNPCTGDRAYVPVLLPPGAPRVYYSPNTIRYDYGPQSVRICFGPLGCPKVVYSQKLTDIPDRLIEGSEAMIAAARRLVVGSRVFEIVRRPVERTVDTVGNLVVQPDARAGRLQDLATDRAAREAENARRFVPREPGGNARSPAD